MSNELTISEITQFGLQLAELQQQEEQAQKVVDELHKKIVGLTCITLPNMMETANVSEITLADGRKMKLSTIYNAKIPEEKKHAAFAYLESIGSGSLIKNLVSVKYGKSSMDSARELQQFLDDQGAAESYSIDQNVHASTLKAFVKEQKEAGNVLDDDLLGVTEINIVTLK